MQSYEIILTKYYNTEEGHCWVHYCDDGYKRKIINAQTKEIIETTKMTEEDLNEIKRMHKEAEEMEKRAEKNRKKFRHRFKSRTFKD